MRVIRTLRLQPLSLFSQLHSRNAAVGPLPSEVWVFEVIGPGLNRCPVTHQHYYGSSSLFFLAFRLFLFLLFVSLLFPLSLKVFCNKSLKRLPEAGEEFVKFSLREGRCPKLFLKISSEGNALHLFGEEGVRLDGTIDFWERVVRVVLFREVLANCIRDADTASLDTWVELLDNSSWSLENSEEGRTVDVDDGIFDALVYVLIQVLACSCSLLLP